MKVENTDKAPKFNLLKPDGVRDQGHASDVTHVLLNNGETYPVEPGTFKFYKVGSAQGVPYVTFVVSGIYESAIDRHPLAGKRIEVFPASITGIAYDNIEDNDVPSN